MPGGFGTSKCRNTVCFSLVSPLDPKPDPKYKPYLHMKNHHDRLFVIDLEAWKNSLEFYDTVPFEFFTEIINLKDGSERFVKEEYKSGGIVLRTGEGNLLAQHKTKQLNPDS